MTNRSTHATFVLLSKRMNLVQLFTRQKMKSFTCFRFYGINLGFPFKEKNLTVLSTTLNEQAAASLTWPRAYLRR